MSRSARLCYESAKRCGVDGSITWGVPSEDDNPRERGIGFWKWKPRHILHAMHSSPARTNGDILMYSDAGVEFINNVNYIIDRMDQDIFLFGNMYEHAHWCKADIVNEIWPLDVEAEWEKAAAPTPSRTHIMNWHEPTWARFGKQVQASVIFFRVSDYTRKFVKEWLDWCLFEGGRLIDDSPSRTPNHPEFQENRHDQAILTTLAYREGIKLHYWPATYNGGAFDYEKLPEYASDDYPILFHHHRRRNHEWETAA
jgi:hypothetical protein